MKVFFQFFIVVLLFFSVQVFSAQKINNCRLSFDQDVYQCSYGKGGIKIDKKEGDGATPVGEYPLRYIFYRPDRLNVADLQSALPLIPLQKNDGWCDDPHSPFYNQQVTLPFAASHEMLWREDHVYDLIIVVGYNDKPVVPGKGSAIFIHIARAGYTPTAGCIALSKAHLLTIIKKLTTKSHIKINKNGEITIFEDN